MASATLKLLTARSDDHEREAWSLWLRKVARLTARFADECEDDPFAYNETASVSLLASAAVQAGMLSLAEYRNTKGHTEDRRRNAEGRCDLWISTERYDWGIEFKQLTPNYVSETMLETAMTNARKCARQLRKSHTSGRVAGLIVSLYNMEDGRPNDAVREVAQSCDLAWQIRANSDNLADTFLMFDFINRPQAE